MSGFDRKTRRGVFICGSPYTEVSTVAWALAEHPSFWTSPESRFLYRLFGNHAALARPYLFDVFATCAEGGAWLEANGVTYPEFAAALGCGLDLLFQSRAGERRWIDGSPENALIADELLFLFPEALFVGLVQSVSTAVLIDIGESALKEPEKHSERFSALEGLTKHYSARLMQAARAAPDRVMIVDELELLNDPEKLFRELLEFLQEPYDPAIHSKFGEHLHVLGMNLDEARAQTIAVRRHFAQRPRSRAGVQPHG